MNSWSLECKLILVVMFPELATLLVLRVVLMIQMQRKDWFVSYLFKSHNLIAKQ